MGRLYRTHMTIDLYSSTGQKTGTLTLPAGLFEAKVNMGLIHQAVIRQQANRRSAVAHARRRSEVAGSTRKLYAQKHTGRARRGSIRSPLLRGGGKAFGPRKDQNFSKDMPKSMRHAALRSCLSLQAKKGGIMGLENYPNTIKTKALVSLLQKLPYDYGRRLLFVTPERHQGLELSARNVPSLKTVTVPYLNPEDIVGFRSIVFVGDALKKAEEMFGRGNQKKQKNQKSEMMEMVHTESGARNTSAKKKNPTNPRKPKSPRTKKSSASSDSLESSSQ